MTPAFWDPPKAYWRDKSNFPATIDFAGVQVGRWDTTDIHILLPSTLLEFTHKVCFVEKQEKCEKTGKKRFHRYL